ncbi:hypothetical protein ACU8KH_01225 [Lachancea thermotolerans]
MSFWIMMKLAVNSLYKVAIILLSEDPSSFLLLNLILSLGCSSTYSYRSGDLEQASLSLVFLIISDVVPSLSQNILVPLLFYDTWFNTHSVTYRV